ncbi:hypothetical protein AAF712_010775 [Marasmius tenuissimus]|uniref:F-box domain-containing protein n=1 Tax=Marasmius tenuissimus TaxID=585030 RepID=A0ABR2ZN59_9AGAR
MFYRCPRCDLQVGGDMNEEALSEETLALSTSNHPPYSYEQLGMQYIASSKALEDLNLRIQELSTSLASLKKERAREAERNRLYISILHPIRRLPPELLTEIFRIRTYNGVDLQWKNFPGSLDTRKVPWVLGQVCRTWRLVAESTPDLWAKFNVIWTGTVSSERAAALEWLMTLHLEHAQEQPLDISFYSGSSSDSSHGRLQDRLLSLLCSRASQWRSARLQGDVNGLVHLRRFCGAFRSLTSLEIHFSDDDWTMDLISPFRVFEDCPSLTRFTLRGDPAVLLQEDNQIPWGQITRYEARETEDWIPDSGEHFVVLSKLVRVEVCVLDTSLSSPSNPPPPSLATSSFHFLHTLILRYALQVADMSMTPLLNWLILPSLRVLRFPNGLDCLVELVDFLDRSECSLEELTLAIDGNAVHSSHDFPGALTRLLEASALRSLHTLQIRGMPWAANSIRQRMWETILESLTLGAKGNTLYIPRLRRLTLNGCEGVDSTTTMRNHEALCTMVSSRCFIELDVLDERGLCYLEEMTLWNFGIKGTIPLKQSSMDRLLEISSTRGLTFSWYWGDLDWDIDD